MSSKLVFADDTGIGGEVTITMTEDGDIAIAHNKGVVLGFEFTVAEMRQIVTWANYEEDMI